MFLMVAVGDDTLPLNKSRSRGGALVLTILATLLVGAVSAWINFDRLAADRMWGDEATYALIIDRMIASGDPLTVSIDGVEPYFDKSPFGMWLTAATYHLFDDEPSGVLRYRVGSAGFGVLATMLTCILGAMWFSPGVGLVAAMLFAMNGKYLHLHGARHGGFDTGLVAFCLLAVVVYTAWIKQSLRARFAWPMIGFAAGLASMFKPLAGLPLLMLLFIHAMVFVHAESRWKVLRGMLIATVVCLVVWAPWCIYQWARFGQTYLDYFFGRNLAERIVHGIDRRHVHGWSFYWTEVPKSSAPFLFWYAAIVVILIAVWRRHATATAVSLFVLIGVGWQVIFSLSPSKFLHYAYPAFPFIAITIAAAMETFGVWLTAVWPRVPTVAIGWVVVSTAIAANVVRIVYDMTPDRQTEYAPWVAYKSLEPAVVDGRIRVLRYGIPARHDANFVSLYLSKMKNVTDVATSAELVALLTTAEPTLLLTWNPVGTLPTEVVTAQRGADARFSAHTHDLCIDALDLGPVLDASIHLPTSATLPFDLSFTPTFTGNATFSFTLRFDGPAPTAGYAVVDYNRRRSTSNRVPINGAGQTFVVNGKTRESAVGKPQPLSLLLLAEDGSAVTNARVESLSVRYDPRPPVRPRTRD